MEAQGFFKEMAFIIVGVVKIPIERLVFDRLRVGIGQGQADCSSGSQDGGRGAERLRKSSVESMFSPENGP